MEKLKRRKELIKERQEKGLSVDEAILDVIQEEEEQQKETQERQKRKVLFQNLSENCLPGDCHLCRWWGWGRLRSQ